MTLPPLSWRGVDWVRTAVLLVVPAAVVYTASTLARHTPPVCPPVITPALSATEMRFTAADGAELRVTVDGKHWRVMTKESRP